MRRTQLFSLLTVAGFAGASLAQTPLGTQFTYQGRLNLDGSPVNATADFQFTLWDTAGGGSPPAGGNQIGAISAANNVTVSDGLFTTTVDFGAPALNGDARWLQIAVRSPAASGAFQTLAPRQRLTPAPYALKVAGVDGHSLDAADGSPADALVVGNDGTVGVGNAPNLAYQLDVRAAEFDAIRGRAVNTTVVTVGVTGETSSTVTGSAGVWGVSNATTGSGRGVFGQTDSPDGHAGYFQGRGYVSGNLGIGTTSPGAKLHVVGGVRARGGAPGSTGVNDNGYAFSGNSGDNDSGMFSSADGQIEFYTNAIERIRINASGHAGFGTTSPGAPVHTMTSGLESARAAGSNVFGTWFNLHNTTVPNQYWHVISSGSGNGNGKLLFASGSAPASASSEILTLDPAGGVGVGTTSPQGALHVASAANDFTLNLEGDNWAQLTFYPLGHAAGQKGSLYSDGNTLVLTSPGPGKHIRLHTPNGGRTQVRELEILGGADIAEPFEASEAERIAPGMAVCIDPDQPGRLRMSRSAYDPTVAGVVSGAGGVNTGLMLRQESSVADGSLPVALTGRVYCWVDADAGGPVRPGDLLTTSDTPGHAMRAADREQAAGATIGKAMTSLERGTGIVLILVTLQ